jgi:ribose transport system permease protein
MNDRQKDLFQKFAAFAGLLLLVVVFSLTSDAFFTVGNGMTVGLQVTSIALLGVGATCVIIAGGIDLSVGSVLALSACWPRWPRPAFRCRWPWHSACSPVRPVARRGLLVTRAKLCFHLPLRMMLVARGLALQITSACVSASAKLRTLGNGSLFGSADRRARHPVVGSGILSVILMAVIAVAVAVLLTRTRLGRHIHAVGSNAEAARLSGVNIGWVVMFTYVVSGALAGLTGCVLMSRLVTAQPNEGVMYELDAIAAAVIGGTSLIGGVGTISGTVIGSFVIGVLRNGLNMNGVSAFTQQIIIGLVILLAVWIDQLRHRR